MYAGPGVDIMISGPGGDFVFARAQVDVNADGGDGVLAGPGRDAIFVRDGERDLVDCGADRDIVFADDQDVVRRRNCERVRIGEPRPSDDDSEVGL